MKNFKIISGLLLSIIIVVSCSTYDPIDEIARAGQQAPQVYWELKSTNVAAGSPVSYIAQYYIVDDKLTIDSIEIWYSTLENIETSVSCPLLTTFSFTMSSSTSSMVREFLRGQKYDFDSRLWDPNRKAYVMDTTFNTTNTLKKIEWKEVKEFEENKFNDYFPSNFATQFKDSLYGEMQVADFRKMFVSLEKMTAEEFISCTDSTLNPNTKKYDYFFKEESLPLIQNTYNNISFPELIYDATNLIYKIEYEKYYTLEAAVKVYDSRRIVGMSEKKVVELR